MTDVNPDFPRYRLPETVFDGPLVEQGDEVEVLLVCDVAHVPGAEARGAGTPAMLRVRDFAGPREHHRESSSSLNSYRRVSALAEANRGYSAIIRTLAAALERADAGQDEPGETRAALDDADAQLAAVGEQLDRAFAELPEGRQWPGPDDDVETLGPIG